MELLPHHLKYIVEDPGKYVYDSCRIRKGILLDEIVDVIDINREPLSDDDLLIDYTTEDIIG